MYFRILSLVAGLCAWAALSLPASAERLMLQNPTMSRTQIAFVYGGDIWAVDRSGGAAHRVLSGYAVAGNPFFSPDGTKIAFSATYDGNVDVYTVPVTGGEPTRLTFHPAADIVIGWTPDGKNILFRSNRRAPTDAQQLYAIAATGGEATMLPLPDAQTGSYSPDESHFAYVPNGQWEPYWQNYRGGQTTPIWIADMRDSSVTPVPRKNSNDRDPMWIGNSVYFLSDRDGPFTLFAYNPGTTSVKRLLPSGGFGIVSASASGEEIVYSTFDTIHVYNTASGSDRAVPISISAELPAVRPHWLGVGPFITNAGISPTGVRAVFEAHGDIFTVPAENGDIRNLTATAGTEERDPAWSPDGKSIAYFSDASGEYDLRIKDQLGLKPERAIELEPRHSYYYAPTWSPDGKRIAYLDKHLGIYFIDVSAASPKAVKIGEQPYEDFSPATFNGVWSPDSRYLAYAQALPSFQHAIVVYDTQTRERHQVTDGLSDAQSPAFDASGNYLYFSASTNVGLTAYGLDMTADQHPVTSSVYAMTLHKDTASPTAPQTAEEPVTDEAPASPKPKAPAAAPAPKPIDFAGIGQRIVALPLPEANYVALAAGSAGQFFVATTEQTSALEAPARLTLSRFDLATRKPVQLADGISGFVPSHDGKKLLINSAGSWFITSSAAPFKGEGRLATQQMQVHVEPHEEWAQMFRETWRIEREFFYDPNFHGLDLAKAQAFFAQFLPGLASRSDFTYLTQQMIGYLEVGHLWVYGGYVPPLVPPVTTGLLGADYTVAEGHERIAKIYTGENWNPALRAPLTAPGLDVHAGDYILAVDGKDVGTGDAFYAAFQQTANHQITVTVGPNPTKTGSREITVVPVASEFALRNLAWIAHNRDVVDKLSGGKLAYVYMPDTEYGGFTNFNRYFFSQVGREGVILDERYNHGGQIADYVIDYLSRKPRAVIKGRDGKTYYDPPLAIFGPKVMIINQYAGSGGDAMPWLFKKAGLGPLVGEKTWGGLVGIGGYPSLMDGGGVMAPRVAIGGLHGSWEVEGSGIAPDVPVLYDPKTWRDGHDIQLETAVRTAMAMLAKHPVPAPVAPAYPNHHPVLPQ